MMRVPMQLPIEKGPGVVGHDVSARAYEVYAHIYGTGQSHDRLLERGGFHMGELITLLYARSFPRDQWAERDKEAMALLRYSS